MKLLNLLMWVTQFGLSCIFPTILFLWLGVWLQNKFSLGIWVLVLCGILGISTSFSSARACLNSMRKAAEELSDNKKPPVAFNDHN
ncbi:MAG: AtpZ/AtpI family protein [Oscillospiraceae bacterium]|nr:AtpZ/AtpI family protein [Oscillospiraceae bacterium]